LICHIFVTSLWYYLREGVDYNMKQKLVIIIAFLLTLTGCSQESIDYEKVYEEYYRDVKYDSSNLDFDICGLNAEGIASDIEFVYVQQFDDLNDMIVDENARFVYGEVYRIEEYNCIADSAYFMVYHTEFAQDQRELIRVSINEETPLTEGHTYILNVVYNEANDVYFLSQLSDSIIYVNTSGTLSGSFLTDDYPNDAADFIDAVFELRFK